METQIQYDRIRNAILSGLVSLNLNIGTCTWHPAPRQSVIIHIASLNKKGCRTFYRVFRAKANYRVNTSEIEDKWHAQLNSTLSVTFWDNAWRLHASIKDNNQLKWLECQILRNSLFTNNRVSKFKNISDRCDLCGHHAETPLTLFTQCPLVQVFWAELKDYLAYFSITLPITRLQVLFGIHSETFDSIKNITILIGKRVIWVSKFKKIAPSINSFKKYLKDYLIVLSYCHSIKNTSSVFEDQWGSISWILAGHHGPQLPPRDE